MSGQLSLFDEQIKAVVTYDGKRYFAVIGGWYYGTGDTALEAAKDAEKKMISEQSFR